MTLGGYTFTEESEAKHYTGLTRLCPFLGRLAAGSCQVNFQSALCCAGSAAVLFQLAMSAKDAQSNSTPVQAAADSS